MMSPQSALSRNVQQRFPKPRFTSSQVTLSGHAEAPLVRYLAERDRPAIQDHLLALSNTDRERRFHNCLSDFAIIRYVRDLDFGRMAFSGAFHMGTGKLIGLAEAHMNPAHKPDMAEMSICVLPDHRGRGLGTDLLDHLITAVRARGVRHAEFYFQPANRTMIRLVRSFSHCRMVAIGYAVVSLIQEEPTDLRNMVA